MFHRTPSASKPNPALFGILPSMACGRIALTFAIVSNTSVILGARYSGLKRPSRCMPYLIDSDVLIDISRGQAAREYIDALPEGWAISQISALELIVGPGITEKWRTLIRFCQLTKSCPFG